MKKKLKSIYNQKKLAFFSALAVATNSQIFAQGGLSSGGGNVPKELSGLSNLANQIMGIFTSPIVSIILVCCLIACGVTYAYNKDNENMKKKVIAVAIGIFIVVCAQGIVNFVWSAALSK